MDDDEKKHDRGEKDASAYTYEFASTGSGSEGGSNNLHTMDRGELYHERNKCLGVSDLF